MNTFFSHLSVNFKMIFVGVGHCVPVKLFGEVMRLISLSDTLGYLVNDFPQNFNYNS